MPNEVFQASPPEEMTAADHIAEAERLLGVFKTLGVGAVAVERAQVHATLAVAKYLRDAATSGEGS